MSYAVLAPSHRHRRGIVLFAGRIRPPQLPAPEDKSVQMLSHLTCLGLNKARIGLGSDDDELYMELMLSFQDGVAWQILAASSFIKRSASKGESARRVVRVASAAAKRFRRHGA